MSRLYFLAENLQSIVNAKSIFNRLEIPGLDIHVWGRNRQQIVEQDLNPLAPMDQSDLIHSGEQGALLGCGMGFIIGMGVIAAAPPQLGLGVGTLLLVTAFITLFGSWVGGLVGMASDNYQLEPFHQQVDDGQFLVLLDTEADKADRVIRDLTQAVPTLHYAGENDSWNNPLHGSFVKHRSNGHYNSR